MSEWMSRPSSDAHISLLRLICSSVLLPATGWAMIDRHVDSKAALAMLAK